VASSRRLKNATLPERAMLQNHRACEMGELFKVIGSPPQRHTDIGHQLVSPRGISNPHRCEPMIR
jgi:hypothetical protein